jgi:hypothetical protein
MSAKCLNSMNLISGFTLRPIDVREQSTIHRTDSTANECTKSLYIILLVPNFLKKVRPHVCQCSILDWGDNCPTSNHFQHYSKESRWLVQGVFIEFIFGLILVIKETKYGAQKMTQAFFPPWFAAHEISNRNNGVGMHEFNRCRHARHI